jgi:Ca-activated chloride channel family protein
VEHLASRNKRSANGLACGALSWLSASRSWSLLLIALMLLALMGATVFTGDVEAQSGRLKDNSKTKSRPAPIAEPGRPVSSQKPSTGAKETGATKESGEVDAHDIVRISSNLVPIPASVIDPKGHAVTGLKLEDFELWIDGQLKSLSEITRSETPVRLAMLFDNSGSIDFARDFEKEAAMHFFRKVMRATDEAAVFSVETDSYLAQPLTSDIRRLEQTIAGFGRPSGATSLFDAIVDAAGYLRPHPGRRVIVIVSDGVETTSRADFETTMRKVLADNCQIFVVQTGLYDSANVRALAAERRMEQFAIQTGGAAYIPRSTHDLDIAFREIAADLAQQYVLSYYQPEHQRDGRMHIIDLRVKMRKDVRVRARKAYYSPKAVTVAATERD